MKPYIKNLGKISITVDKDYYNATKPYDRLVIVEKENDGTYISRQAVPANTSITNREYWIPLVTINGSFDYMIETTTEELRNLKADGNLIPGMNYMITDYNPTVTGTVHIADRTVNISNQLYLKNNTQVAPFDIVLTALSTTDISEKGLAVCKHYTNRETRQRYHAYWRNTNFTAWELNVIVDTDDDRRPSWCKGEGAPVWISYMKDEWGNEAPFDFKTYGISLPDGATINETYNSEELDNNNVWLKGNRWHIFTYYENDDFAYDSSLEGYVKNVKITDWNIIIGGIINSSITGASNIIVNTNDIQDERFENIIVEGDLHRMWGSAPDRGNNNVIKGYSNIVVSSAVTTEGHNSHCIIKDSESVYLGNYNNNIVIRNCSDINIGNNNSDWDINYAANVYIGNNNTKTDNDTDPNYIYPGYSDGEIANVGDIVIGDNNENIRLYAVATTTIENNNKKISIRCSEDGYQCSNTYIGSNNRISIYGLKSTNFNIGNYNNIGIIDNEDLERGCLSDITIGNENQMTIIPVLDNQNIQANVTIGNYNHSPRLNLGIGLSDVGKFCYFDGTNWQFKTY